VDSCRLPTICVWISREIFEGIKCKAVRRELGVRSSTEDSYGLGVQLQLQCIEFMKRDRG
jgi:hypothetical protein